MARSAQRNRLEKRIARTVEDDTERSFVLDYFGEVAADDLSERSAEDLVGAARSFAGFARKRDIGTPKVRAYNPSKDEYGWASAHTVVEVVADDMPFLVDSLAMALNRRSYTIQLTVHPVFVVDRTAKGRLRSTQLLSAADHDNGSTESWQQVEIDRETDPQRLAELVEVIHSVLNDVAVTVADWTEMRTRAHRIRVGLEREGTVSAHNDTEEIIAFLDWMESNQFTFIGYREYSLHVSSGKAVLRPIPETGLGILRDERSQRTERVLPEESLQHVRSQQMLIITKANSVSTVHRPAYLDYVGVKTFDEHGKVTGERRFLGLFTSLAYSRNPRTIPLLRKKIDEVMHRSGLAAESHTGKALAHILETYPRDELFQSNVDELLHISTGIVQLQERQRVKLFVRSDAFLRFFSCIIYVPRDRYNTATRKRIENVLLKAFDGESVESSVALDESILARVHMIVRTDSAGRKKPSLSATERSIAEAVRSWEDNLHRALLDRYDEQDAKRLHSRYADAFSAAYREDVEPDEAVEDIGRMEQLGPDSRIAMSLRLKSDDGAHAPDSVEYPAGSRLRFKILRPGQHIAISDILPILENIGLRVIAERPYEVHPPDGDSIWIQDVDMRLLEGAVSDIDAIEPLFQDAVASVWYGGSESDRYNRLVLTAGLDYRHIMLLRAYGKYLMQTGLPFSRRYMAETLAGNATVARGLVRFFEAKFDPDLEARRSQAVTKRYEEIRGLLDGVDSLDADRILRAYGAAIRATLRTNFYQGRDPESVAIKLDSARVPELPLPLPRYEIFVYSPRFEAVHLRGGLVARGGLRWSDRPEDFRTEVLGLMKAQQVKNAVIVPVGAKGGFVVKQPLLGDRSQQMEVVRSCYADFLRGMLDMTDNVVDSATVSPSRCVRHDGDDPYLVVAADKGTATFSDLANSVAAEYEFWLGDAFASGGSVGYDHKKMGITARGAWESVARHFRELEIDYRGSDFSVVGIGDMAGDVFGNGMLCSRHIRLIAAFNHMHIFIDPEPDAAGGYAERRRLFGLKRSTWEDYDGSLISPGGGVFSRADKSIRLSREAAAALGTDRGDYTPGEIISLILKAPVDLLWNGGIGTYVKAAGERHREVGDRANDSVRINGRDLRCLVVGEGGNLGFTQAGRIEYARAGGRINTDFIDNSGGVDCSDREVNIKILLAEVRLQRKLSGKRRDALFLEMTDEVGGQVLRDNYLQAQALSFSEAQGENRLAEYAQLIRTLERTADLNRALEGLPDDEAIQELGKRGEGLSRPELAILLAHAKNDIYRVLLASDVPRDQYLSRELRAYFPDPLRRKYALAMEKHRLRDELICTAITNSIVNRMGPSFSQRMCDDTGADHAAVARAYAIAREVFGVREVWAAIEEDDHTIPASWQMKMLVRVASLIRNVTRRLLSRPERLSDIQLEVGRFAEGISHLRENLSSLLPDEGRVALNSEANRFVEHGASEALGRFVASVGYLYSAIDLVELAEPQVTSRSLTTAASAYFGLAERLPLEWLRLQIEGLPVDGHWQSVARGTLRENFYRFRSNLTGAVLAAAFGTGEAGSRRSNIPMNDPVDLWIRENSRSVEHAVRIMGEMQSSGTPDYAAVSVAVQELRRLSER